MRQLDSRDYSPGGLCAFYAYGVGRVQWAGFNVPTQAQLMQTLALLGFAVPMQSALCRTAGEVAEAYQRMGQQRASFSFDIDGMVVKLNSLRAREELGYTARAPRWALALKFSAAQAETRAAEHAGAGGPHRCAYACGHFKTGERGRGGCVAGNLRNEGEIKAKDVRPGDSVIVQRAGDVIPEVVRPVWKNARQTLRLCFQHHLPQLSRLPAACRVKPPGAA